MGVVDKDFARSLSSESSVQTTWIEVSRTLVHQLLGRGARYGSLAGGEVGKQLFVSNPSYPPSSPLRHPLLAGGVRFKGTKMSKKGLKRKKAREVRLKLKKIRKEKKAKKAAMSPEQRLEHGIYKVTFLLPMLEYLWILLYKCLWLLAYWHLDQWMMSESLFFLVPDFFPVLFWSHFSYGKKLPYMKNKSRRSISCQNFQSLTQIQRFWHQSNCMHWRNLGTRTRTMCLLEGEESMEVQYRTCICTGRSMRL